MGAAVKQVRKRIKVPVGATGKRTAPGLVDKAKGYEIVWAQVTPVFEVAARFAGITYVYFIGEEDEGPVKIGTSKDPISRLRAMQTGNPRRLRIEYVLIGGPETERLLHEMWEPFAVLSSRAIGRPGAAPGTEWFKSEIRETLMPIVATAAAAHIERLSEGGQVTSDETERLIRQAHALHGHVAHKHEEMRMLGADGCSVVVMSRHSRV